MKKNIFLLSTDTCYGIACSVDDVRSYEKIYKIKKRNFLKPLAIMVENLQWLEDNTDLNEEQIIDLKEYPHPFTIICQSSVIQALLQFDDEKHFYKNKDVYEKIAFRVAHTSDQTKLLKKV
jgi:L-threonylcarbamoyladenylate synthase